MSVSPLLVMIMAMTGAVPILLAFIFVLPDTLAMEVMERKWSIMLKRTDLLSRKKGMLVLGV